MGMAKYKGYNKNFEISDKVAVVTGGTSGLGNAIAKLYYEKGAKVVILGTNPRIEKIASELGAGVIGINADLKKLSDIDNAVKHVMDEYRKIDILCNSAGIGQGNPVEEVTEEQYDLIMAVNMKGLFFMTQRVGKEMIQAGNGGKIVSIASIAGIVGTRGHTVYGPSKASVLNLTKTLAEEWGRHGINVNAISPTISMTPMGIEVWKGEKGEKFREKIPIGRFVEPEEVAACALFLASDASDMITGENIVIDGGYSAV